MQTQKLQMALHAKAKAEAGYRYNRIQIADRFIFLRLGNTRLLKNKNVPVYPLKDGFQLAYPVCCQYDESVIICRSGLPRLSNNASRFSAGFSR